MSWLLAGAVLAAVAWIIAIVMTPVIRGDRRRRLAAEADALQVEADRLEAARPGGEPERAIEVTSASQIEPRAERGPCPRCGGNLHVLAHTVRSVGTGSVGTGSVGTGSVGTERLRHVVCRCGGCGTERVTWFRVGPRGVTAEGIPPSPC